MATVPDWEWVLTGRSTESKEIAFASVLPASTNEYGGSVVSDNQTPVRSRTYEAEKAPDSIVELVETAYLERKGTMTILGWTGYVTAYSATLTAKGADRWDVSVTLSRPLVNLSNQNIEG